MSSGNHSGGFNDTEKGTIDGHEVTFATGWGDKEGQTLIADGTDWDEKDMRTNSENDFYKHENYNHYNGKGGGKDRGKYTGPGR